MIALEMRRIRRSASTNEDERHLVREFESGAAWGGASREQRMARVLLEFLWGGGEMEWNEVSLWYDQTTWEKMIVLTILRLGGTSAMQ